MLAAIQSYIIANYKAKNFYPQPLLSLLHQVLTVAPLLWLWTKVPYSVILYSSQHNGHPCLFADVDGGAVRELG